MLHPHQQRLGLRTGNQVIPGPDTPHIRAGMGQVQLRAIRTLQPEIIENRPAALQRGDRHLVRAGTDLVRREIDPDGMGNRLGEIALLDRRIPAALGQQNLPRPAVHRNLHQWRIQTVGIGEVHDQRPSARTARGRHIEEDIHPLGTAARPAAGTRPGVICARQDIREILFRI